jgi:hypothetical protein
VRIVKRIFKDLRLKKDEKSDLLSSACNFLMIIGKFFKENV